MDRLSVNVTGGGETAMDTERLAVSWARTARAACAAVDMAQLLNSIKASS